MSPGASADHDAAPLRQAFSAELEQLRLQVELMGVRVDENLERMREVLASGSEVLVGYAFTADDEIDAMNVSLTERCYAVLAQQTPVASDLRLVTSVIRVIGEFERIGDLALRVVKLAPDVVALQEEDRSFDILTTMATHAVERYRQALRAWGTCDLGLATELATERRPLGLFHAQLVESRLGTTGPGAVQAALRFLVAGQALDRIADHAAIIGSRVRYLITGDPAHLAAEVR
jgi:phosphate transport system protein